MLNHIPRLRGKRQRRRDKLTQSEFAFAARRTRGGKREGAGRKSTRPEGPGVSHRRRPLLASRFPVHVSLKVRAGLPNLRGPKLRRVVLKCLRRGQKRKGFRLVHFSIQGRHVHIVAEAVDARALARGIQGLSVRLARRINQALGTKGKVFADRYYVRVLKTPTETRNAVCYVINNLRKHEAQYGRKLAWGFIDPLSSGPHFDGWKDAEPRPPPHQGEEDDYERVGIEPTTWLLKTGWRLRGLLSVNTVPGSFDR